MPQFRRFIFYTFIYVYTHRIRHYLPYSRRFSFIHVYMCIHIQSWLYLKGGGLGSSTISKNLMSPTPRRKWYLTTGRRAH